VTDKGLGIFVHLSSSSFGFPDPLTLANVQSINLPSYNMDQWFTSVIVPSGARYAVFTTKHAGGLSWWPTAAGNWNIAQTAFGVAHPGADLVRDWVGLCRKYNIGVGLYINPVYDPWFLNNSPGHDGTYHNPAFTTYVTQHLTELLSNYGQIDLLWLDIGGSYNAAWSDMAAVRNSLQPNCQLVNNSHEFNLVNGDIVEYEGSGRGDVPPTAGNSVPSEFCEDSRTNNAWVWTGIPSDDVYHDIWYVVNNIISLRAARTSYLLNFPITTGGVQAASSGTFASQIGAYMGKRGGAVLPAVINVTAALDRGDGTLGTRGSGINGSNILGLP
jgi:alpha-L-fucosidase